MEFNKAIRLLLPCAQEGVLKAKRLSRRRVVDSLGKVNFVTRLITDTEDETLIKIHVLDDDVMSVLLAGEAHNFFLASRFTWDRSHQTQPGNAAWQVVENYYAAYYAVHYLIRITGVGLTNIDQNVARLIVDSQLEVGENRVASIPKGKYVLRYEEAANILTLRFDKRSGSGGSHKDAWALWLDLVNKINQNSNVDPTEYAALSVSLSAHRNFVLRSAGRYNPPELRGEINYQFKGGLWGFESESVIRGAQNAILNQLFPVPHMRVNSEALIANNNLIIRLAKETFLHSSSSYPRSISRSLANKYSEYLN